MSDDLTRWNRAGRERFRYVDGNAATFLEEVRLALLSRFLADPPAENPGVDSGRSLDWWKTIWAAPPDASVDSAARQELDTQLAEIRTRLRWGGPLGSSPLWVPLPARRELEGERSERLLAQYEAPRQDLGWETVRAFARAAHLLGEHLNAQANEGFLGTATQWESVRRLVAMLDVRPAPPASASTILTFAAKEGVRGKVARGFQVKHSPPEGGAAVLFETLDELEVDAALNLLRPRDFDRNPEPVSGDRLELAGRVPGLKVGEPLILEDEASGKLHAHRIRGVLEAPDATWVDVSPAVRSGVARGRARIHLVPKDRLVPIGPAAHGAQVGSVLYLAEEPVGLQPGEIVWISDGRETLYRRVQDVRQRRLIFAQDLGGLAVDHTVVGRAIPLPIHGRQQRAVEEPQVRQAGAEATVVVLKLSGDWSRLTGQRVGDLVPGAGGKPEVRTYSVMSADYLPIVPSSAQLPDAGYTQLRLEWTHAQDARNPQALLAPPLGGLWRADRFLIEEPDGLPLELRTGKPKKSAGGDLAVVVRGGRLAWTRLAAVEIGAEEARLRATAWQDRGGAPFFLADTIVYSHFEKQARLAGWQENPTPLSGNQVPLALPELPAALRPGRLLVAGLLGRPGKVKTLTVASAEPDLLVLNGLLPDGATHANLLLWGNAALAGHGEAREEKVLGSGDGARSHQSFVFQERNLAFVADPAQPAGVRADVEVKVGERTWHQVASFVDSGPTDPHYTVRITEDGWLEFGFGDGRRGRRLPTGANNVRLRYRVGTGLAGNLPAGRLEKPARPHPLIAEVRQPLPATGGNDVEGVESMRTSAPGSVATLGRAVSLEDFGRLAASQSSLWQARAFSLPTGLGRQESIRVVVVPAGGGPLGDLEATVRVFLEANALPGVSVRVDAYQSVAFALKVEVQVDSSEFDPVQVVAAVRARLFEELSLRRRALGQVLRIAEIYNSVEAVPGVANSRVTIDQDSRITHVAAPPDHVVYLDPDRPGQLQVSATEFEL